jgi:uncharacterized protein with NRDE domain
MAVTEKGRDVGGFSLVCGKLAAGTGKPEKRGLAVFSNRVKVEGDVDWILGEGSGSKAVGLSNAAFGEGWKKVLDGERLMDEALETSQKFKDTEDELIQRLLGVLSTDTLPRLETGLEDGLETHINQFRNTIFVPAVGRKDVLDLPPDEIAAARKDEKAQVVNGAEALLGVSGLYGTQ